jgi:hypothetical protein
MCRHQQRADDIGKRRGGSKTSCRRRGQHENSGADGDVDDARRELSHADRANKSGVGRGRHAARLYNILMSCGRGTTLA